MFNVGRRHETSIRGSRHHVPHVGVEHDGRVPARAAHAHVGAAAARPHGRRAAAVHANATALPEPAGLAAATVGECFVLSVYVYL